MPDLGRTFLAMEMDSRHTAERIGDLNPDCLKSQNPEDKEPLQTGDGIEQWLKRVNSKLDYTYLALESR
uniref:Uncharacterized protein n=1 Tax=Solanum tuberosum TaxID=4113 RepID=M1DYV7_SOLTU